MNRLALVMGNSGSGGLQKFISFFMNYQSQYEVKLFCGLNIEVNENSHVKVVKTAYANEDGVDLLLSRRLNKGMIALVDNFNPDIVIFLQGYIRRGLEKYKCLAVLHNQLAICDGLLFQQRPVRLLISLLAVRRAVRYSLKRSDGVIFLSEASKKEVDGIGLHYADGVVALFGRESNLQTRKEHAVQNRMIYVATSFLYKNHERLLQSLSKLKQEGISFHVTFVGVGKNKRIIDLIHAFGLSNEISIINWVSHEEVIELIHDSPLYINASLIESTSNGVLEGVVEGNSIICSDIPVFREALEEKAYYFDPTNVEDMTAAIKRALSGMNALSLQDAKKILSKYSAEKQIETIYSFAERITNK